MTLSNLNFGHLSTSVDLIFDTATWNNIEASHSSKTHEDISIDRRSFTSPPFCHNLAIMA